MTIHPPHRPNWAKHLDRMSMSLIRLGHHLLGRPSEGILSALVRPERPGMNIDIPQSSVDALTAGREAFAAGQYAEALHHFGQVLEMDPSHPWGWHGRGDALQLMGQHADAKDAYLRAAALQPDEPLHVAGAERAMTALMEKGVEGKR